MIEGPLVSVLMTAYNREQYIAEAIESVIASTYINFELIIVDDCSTDNTLLIARNYEKMDSRIKVYLNNQNLGDYLNRNKAASYSTGKYIKYLDADDIIYRHSLSYMVESMELNPSAAMGISFNTIDDVLPYPHLSSSKETIYAEFLGKSFIGCGPSGTILTKEVFDKFNGFSGTQFIGDHELWFKIAKSFDILKLQPALVWWRSHYDQQSVYEKKNISIQNIRFQKSLKDLFSVKNYFDDENFNKSLVNLKKRHMFFILKKLIKERKLWDCYLLWRLSNFNLFDIFLCLF